MDDHHFLFFEWLFMSGALQDGSDIDVLDDLGKDYAAALNTLVMNTVQIGEWTRTPIEMYYWYSPTHPSKPGLC